MKRNTFFVGLLGLVSIILLVLVLLSFGGFYVDNPVLAFVNTHHILFLALLLGSSSLFGYFLSKEF